MNANLDKIAKDLYGKIQTRFPDIKIGDENAEVLSKKEDIPRARFFEFEYEENGEPLGTIAITLDAEDGVVLQVSGDLVNDKANTTYHSAFKFIRGFRQFAKDRLLNFDVQNIGKSNLDKRDYEFQAKRKDEIMSQTPIMENKMYGTAHMSYQDLGEDARLVVKHTQPVNLEAAAGRTMHIDRIYIENAAGERFAYPFKHLNGARALAEHIKHGGNPYDPIGKHICSLSEELASLRKFKGYVNRQEQVSEAMGNVTDRVLDRIDSIKETIQKLQRPAYYESFVESFEAQEEQMIPEEIQNDLIDRLTIRTFNEDLKSVFPYIYKFVDESELPALELGVDDILGEDEVEEGVMKSIKRGLQGWSNSEKALTGTANSPKDIVSRNKGYDDETTAMLHKTAGGSKHSPADLQKRVLDREMKKRSLTPEDQFESFMNSIVNEDQDELFSPNKDAQNAAVEKLNQILAQELKGGPEGVNAIESLKGLIDDPELLQKFRDLPNVDVRSMIIDYVQEKDAQIALQLNVGEEEPGGETPPEVEPLAPAPEAEIPPAPAPEGEAPVPAPVPGEEIPPVPPTPVAEAKDTVEKDEEGNVKSWKHEGDWKKADKKDARGKVTNASGQALKKSIEIAKKAGATLETQLDFGHGIKTLAEIIEECGMTPQEVGFEAPVESGLPAMLKFISGFYNKETGNFPLGGMRMKIKVKKEFEDGMFGESSPEDLVKVLKFIDMKDPSGDEQHNMLRLAGVSQPVTDEAQGELHKFDIGHLESRLKEISGTTPTGFAPTPEMDVQPNSTYSESQSLARIISLIGR